MDAVPEIANQLVHNRPNMPAPSTVCCDRGRTRSVLGIVGATPTIVRRGGHMSAAAVAKDVDHHNEVYLVGRLSGEPVERTLPSGDVLLAWRLVVDRPAADRSISKAVNDTLECSTVRASIRRSVSSWSPGDVVEVEGVLRRRFWRGAGGGLNSKYEVEAVTVKRLRRG
jgi:single-strand DNA-binding protein